MSENDQLLAEIKLDQFSSTPLYRQVAESLRDRIVSGELAVGTPLPTENTISKTLGIGISTVRSAYAALVKEGLVTRRPRRGSFVSSPERTRQLDGLYSFSSETRRLGKVPSTKVLSFTETTPSPEVKLQLELTSGERIFEIIRVRLADDTPIMLEGSHIPVRICPKLTKKDVEGSLYEAITQASGSVLALAHEVHKAVVLDVEQAQVLGRSVGTPAFLIFRTTQNARGEKFEYCVSVCPADTTHYEITLRPDSTSISKVQARQWQ